MAAGLTPAASPDLGSAQTSRTPRRRDRLWRPRRIARGLDIYSSTDTSGVFAFTWSISGSQQLFEARDAKATCTLQVLPRMTIDARMGISSRKNASALYDRHWRCSVRAN
jgi:hypothetical protein